MGVTRYFTPGNRAKRSSSWMPTFRGPTTKVGIAAVRASARRLPSVSTSRQWPWTKWGSIRISSTSADSEASRNPRSPVSATCGS